MRKISSSAQRAFRNLVIFGSAGLFAYLVWHAGPGDLWRHLARLGWGFTLVVALAGVSHFAKTIAWRITLGEDRNKASFARLFGLRLGAEAAGQLGILGQAFGDSVRVAHLRGDTRTATSVASVTLDRGLFFVTGLIITIAGILAALPVLSLSRSARFYAGTFVLVATTFLALMFVAMRKRWPLLSASARFAARQRHLNKWVEQHLELLDSTEKALFDFHHQHASQFWTCFFLNLACHGLAVLEVCLILGLLGTNIGFLRALIVEGWTKLLNAIGSWNPGNVGAYEGGNVLIGKMLNLSSTTGLALALARRLRAFIWTLVGGACLFFFLMRRGRSEESRIDLQNSEAPGHPTSRCSGEGISFAIVLPALSRVSEISYPALAPVGGLPVVLRGILAAQKMGAAKIFVIADPETKKTVRRSLEGTGRLPRSVEWIDTGSGNSFVHVLQLIASQDPKRRVVFLDAATTYHPSLIKMVSEWRDDSRAMVLASAGDPTGIVALSGATVALLTKARSAQFRHIEDFCASLAATQSVAFVNVERQLWQPIQGDADRLRAEKKLDRWLVKPTDGMYAKLNRRISIPISRQLIKLPVTANMVSIFTLGAGFVSALFFALGGYWHTLLGALLCLFASILDGCDGEVARLKLLESDFGCWLETLCDYAFYFLLLTGMTIGQWRGSGSKIYLVWGGLLLFGALVSFLTVGWQRQQLAAGRPEQYLGIWHSHADKRPSNRLLYLARQMEFIVRRCFFPYALVVFALFGIMNVAFILSVIGANLVWPMALYSSRAFVPARNLPVLNATPCVYTEPYRYDLEISAIALELTRRKEGNSNITKLSRFEMSGGTCESRISDVH